MNNEPNDYDDFDTQIQSDEMIPEWWNEAEDGEWPGYDYGIGAGGIDIKDLKDLPF